MPTIDLTPILEAVISVVCLIITTYAIPWLKNKVDSAKLAKIMQYVEIFAGAAEQIFDAAQGQEKKQYVLRMLAEKGYKIDDRELDAMIENAVLSLHNELKAIETKNIANVVE